METKVCDKCGSEYSDLTPQFYFIKRESVCIKCWADGYEDYKKNQIENKKKRDKQWCKENPEKLQKNGAKYRLKKEIGFTPPSDLLDVKVLQLKIRRALKTIEKDGTEY